MQSTYCALGRLQLNRELCIGLEVGRIGSLAGHFFREVLKYNEGIDGEIEFKDQAGRGSAPRVYLQLKSADSYLRKHKGDRKEICTITIKNRHAEYWQSHAYPVLLVIRDSGGRIRWMNVTEYLVIMEQILSRLNVKVSVLRLRALSKCATDSLVNYDRHSWKRHCSLRLKVQS